MLSRLFLLMFIFTAISFAQNENKIVTDEDLEEPMLIGFCTRDAFSDSSFSWWWNSEYDMYEVDSVETEKFKDEINNYDIKIIMGTWCSDSRREVPRFFKILDKINYPSNKLKIICVDRDKKTESDEINDLNIELVPTIIFSKDGEEKGRIVEAPEDTLEKDIDQIIE